MAIGWAYIPVDEHSLPPDSAAQTARGGTRRAWRWLKRTFSSDPEATVELQQWNRPSPEALNSAVPALDWDAAARALNEHLGDWLVDPQPKSPVQVVIGPPGLRVAEALERLALAQHGRVDTPPTANALLNLNGEHSATGANCSPEEPASPLLVIPRLERWFLRHEQGLAGVRSLVQQIVRRRGHTLVGCDSWAWSFLQRALGVEDMLGKPLTPAPWDAGRLDALFRNCGTIQRVTFRQAGNNEEVFLPCPANGDCDRSTSQETSQLLKNLAARARGNPGVALALWRDSLRRGPDDPSGTSDPATVDRPILWVTSPSELNLPQLPRGLQRLHQFIVHAILVHGGLPECSLVNLLLHPEDKILRHLTELRAARILIRETERWQVSACAYPAVRAHLQGEGFLTDAF